MMKYVAFHLNKDNEVVQIAHKRLLHFWDDFDNGMFWQRFIHKNKSDVIFQNGGSFGTSSWLTLIPEDQIGVFIITNKKGNTTHRYLSNTVNKIIEKLK